MCQVRIARKCPGGTCALAVMHSSLAASEHAAGESGLGLS